MLATLACAGLACASPGGPPPASPDAAAPPVACPAPVPSVDAAAATRLDTALTRYAEASGVLAASASVLQDGAAWTAARGQADLVGPPVTPCDRFRIYSVTKTYTATLAFLLIEDGVLALDDPIAIWYPALPGASTITIRHLLSHTSGLFDYLGDPDVYADRFRAWDHDALIGEVVGHPLGFAPGTAFDYSNTNYLVLGRVIERVTGTRYVDQLRTRILDPFALSETFLEGEEPIPGGFVQGSTLGPDGLRPADFVHPSLAWAAGSLVAPASDVARFGRLLFDGAIVGPASVQAMMTPVVLASGDRSPYGLGLVVYDTAAGPYVGHHGGGSCCDFSTWLGYLPSRRLVVTTALSTGNVSSLELATDLVRALAP